MPPATRHPHPAGLTTNTQQHDNKRNNTWVQIKPPKLTYTLLNSQDLLKDSHDEALFDYYGQSTLVLVDVATGKATPLGGAEQPLIYTRASPSPDGLFFIVEYLERPYSYLVPCGRFPKRVELWDRTGRLVRLLEQLPLAEDIPIAHNSTRAGRRGISWRSDAAAELCWIETQDGGDPKVHTAVGKSCESGGRDRSLRRPFRDARRFPSARL